jgi:hypothetical protein
VALDSQFRYNPLHNDLEAYTLAYGIARPRSTSWFPNPITSPVASWPGTPLKRTPLPTK